MKLTKEQCEEFFYNALCNGMSTIESYGITINFIESEYKHARESLHKNDWCFEDVLMQILREGKCLYAKDEEGSEEERIIVLKDVWERVPNTPEWHLIDMLNENDDADTADAILQTVFYNEIIFAT